ncbi:1972_t:CDS:2, partial [Diversispora eburnea]
VHRIDDRKKSITLFKYEYIVPQTLKYNNNKNNGWKYLITLMKSTPEALGWVEPSLKFGSETVNLVGTIGVSRTSIVYEGKHNNKSVAIKIARKVEYLHCFERERNALVLLSELKSLHIVKILFYNEDALVMTPRGEKVNNLQKKDIKDIITTLKGVHSLKIIYRDLRKYNFLRDSDGNILIINWGYSTFNIEDTEFAGAPSLNRPSFDKNDNIKKRAKRLLEFWCIHGKSDVWDSIYNAIESLDYKMLIQELERVF